MKNIIFLCAFIFSSMLNDANAGGRNPYIEKASWLLKGASAPIKELLFSGAWECDEISYFPEDYSNPNATNGYGLNVGIWTFQQGRDGFIVSMRSGGTGDARPPLLHALIDGGWLARTQQSGYTFYQVTSWNEQEQILLMEVSFRLDEYKKVCGAVCTSEDNRLYARSATSAVLGKEHVINLVRVCSRVTQPSEIKTLRRSNPQQATVPPQKQRVLSTHQP